jgi:hypothetical protein
LLHAAPSFASEAANQVVEEARKSCEILAPGSSSFYGTFSFDESSITYIDLTGDGKDEEIIDSSDFECSISGLFCGSGGCNISVIVNEEVTDFFADNWTVVDWGKHPVLLLAVHGMNCGGSGVMGCVKAVVWSHGAFRSVGMNEKR